MFTKWRATAISGLFSVLCLFWPLSASANEAVRLSDFQHNATNADTGSTDTRLRLQHQNFEITTPERSAGTETVSDADGPAILGQLPSTVYMTTSFEERSTGRLAETGACTGVLIQKQLVLTAAHCVVPEDPMNELTEIVIAYGFVDLKAIHLAPTPFLIDSFVRESVAVHADFRIGPQKIQNDVAVVLLPAPVIQTEYVEIARLAGLKTKNLPFHFFYVSGWGETLMGAEDVLRRSDTLLWAKTKPKGADGTDITKDQLQEWFEEPIVAAGYVEDGKTVNICAGDSGGGLFVTRGPQLSRQQQRLIAIASYGRNLDGPSSGERTCAHPRVTSEFMNVMTQRAFLRSAALLFGVDPEGFLFDD